MPQLKLQILQTLHGEHLITLGLLERLEALLKRRRADDAPREEDAEAAALLHDLVAVMKEEITHHFAFEEEHLFPRFSQFANPGIPMMLKDEHAAIRPLARRVTELAGAASSGGFTAESWSEFHRLAGELVERVVFHVQKEEMGFLPALDHMLDIEDGPALAAAYAEMKGG